MLLYVSLLLLAILLFYLFFFFFKQKTGYDMRISDWSSDVCSSDLLDTLVDEKVHDRQSRLSWLREPQPRVASASLAEILEKVALIRRTGISCVPVDPLHEPRMTQFAREGVRYTAQAFQQMRA